MNKIALLEEYIQEDPSDPFLHFALAKEYERLTQSADALAKYLHLLKEHEDYVGTYYHLGKLYEAMEETELARQIFNKGIQIATAANDPHSASELKGALDLLES